MADEVAQQFIQHYYTTFMENLEQLAALYVSERHTYFCPHFVFLSFNNFLMSTSASAQLFNYYLRSLFIFTER
jgi:hypothetical protein